MEAGELLAGVLNHRKAAVGPAALERREQAADAEDIGAVVSCGSQVVSVAPATVGRRMPRG